MACKSTDCLKTLIMTSEDSRAPPGGRPAHNNSREQDVSSPLNIWYKTKKPDCNRTISRGFYRGKSTLTDSQGFKVLEIWFKDFQWLSWSFVLFEEQNSAFYFQGKSSIKAVPAFPQEALTGFPPTDNTYLEATDGSRSPWTICTSCFQKPSNMSS